MDEYNRTGNLTHIVRKSLEYYNKDLPAIEQAQYPEITASKL